MPWITVTRAFDFTPESERRVTVAYPVGAFNVTRECADLALAKGFAKRSQAPKRGPDAPDATDEHPAEVPAQDDHA